ncbi:hypothetical protein ACQY0O_003399 [Thecaphora frezii]
MASSQHFYGQDYQASPLGNRANLLSGLRTGGPNGGYNQQADLMRILTQDDGGSPMKANAAIFTPGSLPSRQQTPLSAHQQSAYSSGNVTPGSANGRNMARDVPSMQASLEEHLAAMRLRATLNGPGTVGFGSPENPHGYYGQQERVPQQQDVQHMLQQQILQQQLAARQQIELMRLQQQQQQQAAAAAAQAHQRYLLAQIHAEYERQAQVAALQTSSNHGSPQQLSQQQLFPQQQQRGGAGASYAAASAQEQRQAAQANIQANLRQRQAQHAYAQMASFDAEYQPQQQQAGLDDQFAALAQQHAQVLALKQQQQQQQQQQQSPSPHHGRNQSDGSPRVQLEQRSWRTGSGAVADRIATPPLGRAGSPLVGQGRSGSPQVGQGRAGSPQMGQGRERTTSGTAESVASWRSRTMTPTIVIDDSASEGSRSAAASFDEDAVEGDQTPETSEEDLELCGDLGKMVLANAGSGASNAKYAGVGKGRAPSAPSPVTPTMSKAPTVHAPKATTRAISLSAAPRHRAFAAEAKATEQKQLSSASSQGLALPPIQPRRQPKGQPMEFKEVNFQARMNSRTRKDAMSKLCASPRAASFGANGLSFGSRIVSAQLS